MSLNLSTNEIKLLQQLAGEVMEREKRDINSQRREDWYRFNTKVGGRVMVLSGIWGIDDTSHPFADANLFCQNPLAKWLEKRLRIDLYQFDVLQDDYVIEPQLRFPVWVSNDGFGVEIKVHHSEGEHLRGAWKAEAPLKDLPRDVEKLRPTTHFLDQGKLRSEFEYFQNLFDGIAPVKMGSGVRWSYGLTYDLVHLMGLEEMMIAMYEEPEALHQVMAYLRDDRLSHLDFLEREGLLALNHKREVGSGTMGYTHDFPQEENPGVPWRLKDTWGFMESQETVGVGPELYAEFVQAYEKPIAERFGKLYYGCCEPLHTRWDKVKEFSNLECVSISPWCDEEPMAKALGRDYIFARKPNPTLICTDSWNEELIRADLAKTLEIARDCRLEIIMKDIHTLRSQPWRLCRWIEIARQEIVKARR